MRRQQKQNQYRGEKESSESQQRKQEQAKNDLKHAIKKISIMVFLSSIFNGK
jgi:hypothetical protein